MFTTIAFIGSGAMAEAIIHGILDKRLVQPGQIIARLNVRNPRQPDQGQLGQR